MFLSVKCVLNSLEGRHFRKNLLIVFIIVMMMMVVVVVLIMLNILTKMLTMFAMMTLMHNAFLLYFKPFCYDIKAEIVKRLPFL